MFTGRDIRHGDHGEDTQWMDVPDGIKRNSVDEKQLESAGKEDTR